jgi:hypothetical protein
VKSNPVKNLRSATSAGALSDTDAIQMTGSSA